jgi:serine/threonine protein kinase
VSLIPGTRLGVYEIIAAVGEGGMGQVFRTTDTKLKRDVAIKILPPSMAADADRLARLPARSRSARLAEPSNRRASAFVRRRSTSRQHTDCEERGRRAPP